MAPLVGQEGVVYNSSLHLIHSPTLKIERKHLRVCAHLRILLHPRFFSYWHKTMDVGYTWMLTQGKNCRQFSLLIWNSFIGQFVHPVRGEGMG